MDLETEQLSVDEAKASSRKMREAGKALSNRSILAEVRERDVFQTQKQSRKERQKAEQAEVHMRTKQPLASEPEELVTVPVETEPEMPEVFDYEQLREDYGW